MLPTRSRFSIFTLVAVLFTFAELPPTFAQTSKKDTYSVIDLGTLGGANSTPVAINASGQVTGSSEIGDGHNHAFLYSYGKMIDLGTLGGSYSEATGINASGQVVGWSETTDGSYHAFLYTNGKLIDLGTLGGANSYADAINVNGWIVGNAQTASGDYHAFLYMNGQMIDLGTLGGAFSNATGINAKGEVVGESDTATNGNHAFLYSGGQMTDINTYVGTDPFHANAHFATSAIGISDNSRVAVLIDEWYERNLILYSFNYSALFANNQLNALGTLGGSYSIPTAINAAGQVAGTSSTGTSQHAYFYSDSKLTDLGTLPGCSSFAADINNKGQVVGNAFNVSDSAPSYHLMFWDAQHKMHDITTLLDATGSGWTYNRSGALLNDRGWITTSLSNGTDTHACLIKPSLLAQVYTDHLAFQENGQSIWDPRLKVFDYDLYLPGFKHDPSGLVNWSFNTTFPHSGYFDAKIGGWHIDLGWFGSIDIPGIDFGTFGAQVHMGSSITAGLHFNAHADAGSVNVNCPTTVQLVFPDRGTIYAGDVFPLSATYDINPAAAMNTTTPNASASLDGIATADNAFSFNAKAFSADLLNIGLPQEWQHVDKSTNIFDSKFSLGQNNDEPYEFSAADGVLNGYVKWPQLQATSALIEFDSGAPSMNAHTSDTFFTLRGSLTDALLQLVGGTLSFDYNDSIGADTPFGRFGVGVDAGLDLLQFGLQAQFNLAEDFSFTPAPHITLALSDPNATVDWWDASQNPQADAPHHSNTIDFDAGQTVYIKMPVDDPILKFVPTFRLNNTFNNTLSLEAIPGLYFDPLHLYAHLDIDAGPFGNWSPGFDLHPWYTDFGGTTFNIPLLPHQFSISFPTIQTAPITVVGEEHDAPRLLDAVATSDPNLPATLDPDPNTVYLIPHNGRDSDANDDFKRFVGGVTTVILEGTNFTNNTTAQFSYYGCTIPLQTTYLNDTALKVSLPNWLRVLPGVGRFAATAPGPGIKGNGQSNALDFPIEYPVPTLDTVSPNLWANDARLTSTTLTLTGTGFINRPDYFQKPPDNSLLAPPVLWTWWNRYVPTIDNRAKATLADTFPNFDFVGPAPMPTAFWGVSTDGGQTYSYRAMQPYIEPYPSGGFPQLLPHGYFDHALLASVYVTNPGKDALPSAPWPLWVAAPKPGDTVPGSKNHPLTFSPTTARPSDPGVHVIINVKPSYPTKYPGDGSNPVAYGFTTDSVVYWNGHPRPTRYVSPSELIVDIDASLLSKMGYQNLLRVVTPTIGKDGKPGTSYVSNALKFLVANPVPNITSLTPNKAVASDAAFDPTLKGASKYNLTIQGKGFSPKAKVYFNGQARTTHYVADDLLQVQLLPVDVAVASTNNGIVVTNPTPGGGNSQKAVLPVTNAAPGATTLTPKSIKAGSPDFKLLVQGKGFNPNSKVMWNGASRPTQFVSSTALTATLTAKDVAKTGNVLVRVKNPTPGGGTSAALSFAITKR